MCLVDIAAGDPLCEALLHGAEGNGKPLCGVVLYQVVVSAGEVQLMDVLSEEAHVGALEGVDIAPGADITVDACLGTEYEEPAVGDGAGADLYYGSVGIAW